MNSKVFSARKIAYFAILLALVVVLQIWGSAIPVGATRLSFTLVPIVLGAIILGQWAGMFLGIAFGAVVLISALVGADPFTMYLLQESPVITLLIIFVKGSLAGFLPGLIYKLLKKRPILATIIAALVAPIANTGVFVVGALIISGVIEGFMGSAGITGQSVVYFVIIGCAGINFLVELGINLILAPALARIIRLVDKKAFESAEEIKEEIEVVETENFDTVETESQTKADGETEDK